MNRLKQNGEREMMQLAYVDDTDRKVKEALETWADYMRHDRNSMGYPSTSAGFNVGGGLSSFDDLAHSCDVAMAKAIEGLLEGLTVSQRLSVHHFHLAAVWRSNRTSLADDYAQALDFITRGLKKRGLV